MANPAYARFARFCARCVLLGWGDQRHASAPARRGANPVGTSRPTRRPPVRLRRAPRQSNRSSSRFLKIYPGVGGRSQISRLLSGRSGRPSGGCVICVICVTHGRLASSRIALPHRPLPGP